MFDYTTEFMKGALLGYCQTHEPEEVQQMCRTRFLGYLNQSTIEEFRKEM